MAKLRETEQTYSTNESFEITDLAWSKLVTFGALVIHYGGWQWTDAVKGARNTAAFCAKMGKPWVWMDPSSQLLMFRLMEFRHDVLMSKSWAKTCQMSQRPRLGLAYTTPVKEPLPRLGQPLGRAPSKADVAAVEVNQASGETDAEPKAGREAQTRREPEPKTEPKPKVKAKLPQAIKDALTLKSDLSKAMAKSSSILMSIKAGSLR